MCRSSELIQLYQEMYEMTEPECCACRAPRSCCSPEYCVSAIEWAKEKWGVELKPTDYSRLPLMGPNGCTAAPHLRPICTIHTCDISSFGLKRGDPEWTKKYWKLRARLEELEFRHE